MLRLLHVQEGGQGGVGAGPVILAVAFPAKAALRLLDWKGTLFVLCYAAAFFGCSLLLWRASLKAYSSASS